ncbi:DUF6636 domain-containing protein [Tabrizicola thermarum]|uniref:DUF6636 domain-containing protein n=1 Tax=Tabrizicola thermarum TaxID=2670345 RepID=UPI000FFC9613|nr:DUF6636 domain-containing protein [Tabrizicola thermarum]
MMRVGVAVAFLGLVAGVAQADIIQFRSPTGNINCIMVSDPSGATARCDLTELTPSYTRRPAGCKFDWGRSFAVGNTGKGYLACVSDAVGGAGLAVLRYGQAVSLGGISCVSAESGMTCTNAKGHGFSVSKAKQKLF